MRLIYFRASWCGSCKSFTPVIEKLKSEGYEIQIIDTDKNKDLATQHKVTSLPTTIILLNEKEVNRFIGAISEDKLRKQLPPNYRLW
jgi:thioredoxin 1